MADTLVDIRAAITLMLSLSGTPEISDNEIDRGVNQASAVLSRFFPREVVAQTVFNEDVADESWTSNHDTAVVLANKPIRFLTETVTDDPVTVTYIKDTDYEIDYVNGTITALSTGSIIDSAAHLITYKMDTTMIDVSSLLTEPISIDQVDVIRNDTVPVEYESWLIHGDFLMITGGVSQSQMRFVDNDHIRIYYLANHAEPTASTSGSYPTFLDEVILIGTAGYALLIEAIEQEHLAIVDLASARTSIGNIAAIHTTIATIVTSIATAQADANIALDKSFVEVALANAEYDKVQAIQTLAEAELANANTELDKAAAETVLASAEATLANTELDKVDAANGGLPEARTELALIITALAAAGDFDVALDKVTTHTGQAITALDLINAELLLGSTALDQVDNELITDVVSAEFYLKEGKDNVSTDLINKTNVGRSVPETLQSYAQTKISIARGFVEEATGRFQHGQALTQESAQRIQASISFIQEANGRLRAVEDKLSLVQHWLNVSATHQRTAQNFSANANTYAQISQAYQTAGERFTNNGRVYTEEARTYIQNGNGYISAATAYIQEGTQRLSAVIRYVEELNSRLSQIRAYLEEATLYQNSAASQRESSDLFRQEGNDRIRQFTATLEDNVQIGTHPRVSSVRQYGSDRTQRILSWETNV